MPCPHSDFFSDFPEIMRSRNHDWNIPTTIVAGIFTLVCATTVLKTAVNCYFQKISNFLPDENDRLWAAVIWQLIIEVLYITNKGISSLHKLQPFDFRDININFNNCMPFIFDNFSSENLVPHVDSNNILYLIFSFWSITPLLKNGESPFLSLLKLIWFSNFWYPSTRRVFWANLQHFTRDSGQTALSSLKPFFQAPPILESTTFLATLYKTKWNPQNLPSLRTKHQTEYYLFGT